MNTCTLVLLLSSVLFSQMCSSYTSYVVQQDQMKIAEVGDSVHLSCISSTIVKTTTVWIQQKFGEKPVEMTSSYQNQPALFYNGFEKSGRFKTQTATGSFNLTISNVEPSDAAIYYCAGIFLSEITFGEGTVLVVKGAHLAKHTVHQQPLLEATLPGDSVTLPCTVLTESCSGEHSVYWFRHGSGESHPRVIHTHGNRSDECENSSETDSSTQSCVYKLPRRNLSLSDAGIYYCAVAACGQVLFGNGTKLSIQDNNPAVSTCFLALIYSNIIWLLVLISAVVLRCKNQSHSAESPTCKTCLNTQVECDDALNFAASSLTKKPPTFRGYKRQQMFKDREVFSEVIYHQQ